MWRGRLQVAMLPSTVWPFKSTMLMAWSFSLDTKATPCADAIAAAPPSISATSVVADPLW